MKFSTAFGISVDSTASDYRSNVNDTRWTDLYIATERLLPHPPTAAAAAASENCIGKKDNYYYCQSEQ